MTNEEIIELLEDLKYAVRNSIKIDNAISALRSRKTVEDVREYCEMKRGRIGDDAFDEVYDGIINFIDTPKEPEEK
jgi:hypothetical protein